MADRNVEREVKLGTWPGFQLPDLSGLAAWVEPGPTLERSLDATYLDAADLRLIRAGATFRYRTGEGQDGRWTAKVPLPSRGDVPERLEIEADAPAGAPPADVVAPVRGLLRGEPLVPVARLLTRRRVVTLVDAGGRKLAEVADDEVSVLEDGRVAARFREVEVEAMSGAPPALLPLVVERLRAAGAGEPDPTPKLARALGPRALAPGDPVVPTVGERPTAGLTVRAALAASVQRLLAHDPGVRLDLGSSYVHQARVSTRRLRSDLRTFESLCEPGWADAVRDELRWLAGALGTVRDGDVLRERLLRQGHDLSLADQASLRRVVRRLDRQRRQMLAELHEVYDSDRYLALVDRLVLMARSPALVKGADSPAKELLPPLVRRPYERLRKGVHQLEEQANDDQLHELRIRAKRARYAAEAAAIGVASARPLAEVLAELTGVLGELHDAVVAEEWLRQQVRAGTSRNQAMVAGLLVARQQEEAAKSRVGWQDVAERAERKKLRAWLE